MKSIKAFVLTIILASLLPSAVFAQNTDEVKARKFYEECEALAKKKDNAGAVLKIDEALRLAPNNEHYLRTAAQLYYFTQKFEDAFRFAQRADKINPQDQLTQLLVASTAFYNHDFALTKEYCKKLTDSKVKFDKQNQEFVDFLARQVTERKFTLLFKIKPKEAVYKGSEIFVPLPNVELPFQKTTYEVTGVKKHRVANQSGNDVLLLTPSSAEAIDLKIHVTRTPHTLKKQLADATNDPFPAEVKAYLGKSAGIDPASPKLLAISRPLKGKSQVATVNNLMVWTDDNIHYQFNPPKHEFKKVEEVIDRKHGECLAFSSLFTALCRSAGIPARQVQGLTTDNLRILPPGNLSTHVWVEVYFSGLGWVSVDPQKGGSLGLDYTDNLRMFHHEDALKTTPPYNLPLATQRSIFRTMPGVKYQEGSSGESKK